jgi:hypothetical protein
LTCITRIGFRDPGMQQLIADSLDDLLVKLFPKILRNGQRVKASKGWNNELSGAVLELRNPLARLSRTETKGTLFSCLGETLWYLARSNELEFIKYYISIYGKFAESVCAVSSSCTLCVTGRSMLAEPIHLLTFSIRFERRHLGCGRVSLMKRFGWCFFPRILASTLDMDGD